MSIGAGGQDWCEVADELAAGSAAALVDLTRLTTAFLVEYRAYDFADGWSDLIQIVLLRVLEDHARYRGTAPGPLDDRLRAATCEELRQRLTEFSGWGDEGELPWCTAAKIDPHRCGSVFDPVGEIQTVRREIENLSEQRLQILFDVYGERRNFDQVAAHRKLPLRAVKRALRESIWEMKDRLETIAPGRDNGAAHRPRSCLRSLELDLGEFLVVSDSDVWQEFRTHYPGCTDCSREVVMWSRVECLIREACGGMDRHPSAEQLVALQQDGEGLDYSQYVSMMRHLDGCPLCGEGMAMLARCEKVPFTTLLENGIRFSEPEGSASSRSSGPVSRWMARIRSALGRG